MFVILVSLFFLPYDGVSLPLSSPGEAAARLL